MGETRSRRFRSVVGESLPPDVRGPPHFAHTAASRSIWIASASWHPVPEPLWHPPHPQGDLANMDPKPASVPHETAAERHARQAVGGDVMSRDWIVAHISGILESAAKRKLKGVLSHHYEAEDLAQETWWRVLPKLNGIRGEHGYFPALRGYVFQTLRGVVRELLRKALRDQFDGLETKQVGNTAIDGQPADQTSVGSRAARGEHHAEVMKAVDGLPELERTILEFRHEDLPFREIGKRVGMTENTATKRYERIRERLRSMVPGSVFEDL